MELCCAALVSFGTEHQMLNLHLLLCYVKIKKDKQDFLIVDLKVDSNSWT